MAALDQLTGLMSLINNVQGQSQTTKTTGGKTTQQTNVSDQGVNQLIQQILSGSGGVKSIGSRARSSGLYNSTGEDILLGNLYSTAANQAELARTPTVTTTAPQTSTTSKEGIGVGGLAANLGGAFLASQALNLGSKLLSPAVESGTNYISDLLGISSGSDSIVGVNGTGTSKNKLGNVDLSVGGGFGGGFGGGDTGISTGEGYGLNTSTLGGYGSSSNIDGAKGINFGFNTDTGSSSVGVSGLGAIGGLLGSIVSGLSGGSSGGGGGGSSGGSVICTALKDLGLLDKELHAAGSKYLNSMHPITVIGYQIWGNKIADKIRAGSKGWIKVALPVARSRTSLLASSGSFMDHIKHPLGTLTKFIGEPVCHLIGHCLPDAIFTSMIEAHAYAKQRGV